VITVLGSADSVAAFFVAPAGFDYEEFPSSLLTFGVSYYRIPPSDGQWYPIDQYYVKPTKVDVGFMDKTHGKDIPYKPVYHGKLNGSIRPRLSPPVSPSFRGTDYAYRVLVDGEFSARDRFMATSYASTGYPSFLCLDNFDDIDPEIKFVQHGDVIVIGNSSLVDPYDFEGDPMAGKRLFKHLSSGPTSSGIGFINKAVREDCSPRLDPIQFGPGVCGFPGMEISTSYEAKVTLTHIRNTGSSLQVKGDQVLKYISMSRHVGGVYHDTIEQPFQSNLVTNSIIWPNLVDVDASRKNFRKFCDFLGYGAELSDHATNCRTQALLKIEDMETNNVENLAGVGDLLKIVGQIAEIWRGISSLNPMKIAQAISNAYLIFKFALEATYSDVQNARSKGPGILKRMAEGHLIHKRRYSHTYELSSPLFAVNKIRLSSEFILQRNLDLESTIVDALDKFDLLPTASRMWDTVPLSFVIDWFLNVGPVLDALSRQYGDCAHYDLVSRVESQRSDFGLSDNVIYSLFGPGWKSVGRSDGRRYRRFVYHDWGSFDAFSLAGGSGISSIGQMFIGGALIIQRL
jgi:hypothetical protein